MAKRNPYAISGQKPQISDLGNIGDTAHTVINLAPPSQNKYLTDPKYRGIFNPKEAAYANLSDWGIEDIPTGANALYVDEMNAFHPVVARGRPGGDYSWTQASPAQYRAYAAAVLKQRAAAAKNPKAGAQTRWKAGGQNIVLSPLAAKPAAATAAGGTAAGAAGTGAQGTAGTGAGAATGAAGTATDPYGGYLGYLANDPTLLATLTQIAAARSNLSSNLVGGAQQLYGRLGEMPSNLSPELAALLGPEQRAALEGVIQQGNQAGTTALAQLQQAYGTGQATNAANYAAAGGASGGYGVHANELLRQNTLAEYNARQTALDTLQSLQQTYLTGQGTQSAAETTALQDARTRAAALIDQGMGLPPGTTAAKIAASGAAAGGTATGASGSGTTSSSGTDAYPAGYGVNRPATRAALMGVASPAPTPTNPYLPSGTLATAPSDAANRPAPVGGPPTAGPTDAGGRSTLMPWHPTVPSILPTDAGGRSTLDPWRPTVPSRLPTDAGGRSTLNLYHPTVPSTQPTDAGGRSVLNPWRPSVPSVQPTDAGGRSVLAPRRPAAPYLSTHASPR